MNNVDPRDRIKRIFPGAYCYYENYSKNFLVIVNEAGHEPGSIAIEGVWGRAHGERSAWKDALKRLKKAGKIKEKKPS